MKELEDVEKKLRYKYSKIISDKIMKEVKGLGEAEDGDFNSGKLWKFKKSSPPTQPIRQQQWKIQKGSYLMMIKTY